MVRHSPHVKGTVTVADVPASGAEIVVQWRANDRCVASSLRSLADASGAFEIPTGRKFELDGISLGDRAFGWRLCIVYAGQPYEAFAQMGWGYPPKEVRLACQLPTREDASSQVPRVPQLCRMLEE